MEDAQTSSLILYAKDCTLIIHLQWEYFIKFRWIQGKKIIKHCRVDQPLTAWGGDPVESVSQVMLVSMVTGCTKVIIGTLSTFPPNTNDGLLSTGVTHGSIMFDT